MIDTITLNRADYEAMIHRIEDLEDTISLKKYLAGTPGPTMSDERVGRLLDGEHPLKLWREERGLTVATLAAKADVSPGYLSEIENGKKPGSVKTLAALADALGVEIVDLLT